MPGTTIEINVADLPKGVNKDNVGKILKAHTDQMAARKAYNEIRRKALTTLAKRHEPEYKALLKSLSPNKS